MSSQTPALKRHNHRVHPCKDEKKESLLKLLLSQNSDKNIIVATSIKSELTTEQKNVSILSDEELIATPDAQCEMLISYDLPSKAIKYMARIAHTSTYALILVNPSEEKLLHPIETLIGRTLMQELVEGFSEVVVAKTAQPVKKDFDPREERKRKFLGDEEKAKKRTEAKKRSAQKAFSYVSMVNGKVETHKTWAECEKRVRGVGGVKFKKSLSAADEKNIIA